MRYMGSKLNMLKNGLGKTLTEKMSDKNRFIDLFCGSASVSWFIAEKTGKQVICVDLQKYSTVIAESVISRTYELNSNLIFESFLTLLDEKAKEFSKENAILLQFHNRVIEVNLSETQFGENVLNIRKHCGKIESDIFPITYAYGGYYFSPMQTFLIDMILKALSGHANEKELLASLILAASDCAAAPGHTAQPFGLKGKSRKYLVEAWNKDILITLKKNLELVCSKKSGVAGIAYTGDALECIEKLNINDKDLVFIDPPYTGVHYSRFYHVLETIAIGECSEVTGSGRYPPIEERPQSNFSKKASAFEDLKKLLGILKDKKCVSVITFPKKICSNGMSGDEIVVHAQQFFKVTVTSNKTKFSKLGGNNENGETKSTDELIIILEPLQS